MYVHRKEEVLGRGLADQTMSEEPCFSLKEDIRTSNDICLHRRYYMVT